MIKILENLFNPLGFLMNVLKSSEERLQKIVEGEESDSYKRAYVKGTIKIHKIWRDSFIENYGKKNKGVKLFSDGINELTQRYSQYL